MIAAARESGTVIDATQGRKTKAVIVLEDGRLLLSALQPETIMRRFNAGAAAAIGQEEETVE